jgi:hypothetical protein
MTETIHQTIEIDSTARAAAVRSIANFLRMGHDAYPTPDEAAEGLLRRLAHDGLRIVPADGEARP